MTEEPKQVYAKPDYDESRSAMYDVLYRNWIGIKMQKNLSVSFKKLQVVISEPDNGKAIVTIPAANIKMAIPSENVDSQVTIMCQHAEKDVYKVWTNEDEKQKVKLIIRDINQIVQLYKDLQEEQAAEETKAAKPVATEAKKEVEESD